MAFVQFSKVSLAFGDRDILKNVSVNLSAGSKAALTGANGSGKSTLMKVMAGLMECDSGDRAVQKDCRIGYLPQSGIVHHGCTLLEEADRAFSYGYSLHNEMEDIGAKLAEDPNSPGAMALLDRQHEIITWLEDSGWNRRDVLARQTLEGLGFKPEDMNRSVEEFSGGWQMRIALAKVLLEKPDILLLDEPTNYLDAEHIAWLTKYLQDYENAFILISHDIPFLNSVINIIYHMDGNTHTLERYVGDYDKFQEVYEMKKSQREAAYNKQQQEIAKLKDFVARNKARVSTRNMAMSRQKKLDNMDIIEKIYDKPKPEFNFKVAKTPSKILFETKDLVIGYDEPLSSPLNISIERGYCVVLTGANGIGKTTLLKSILGLIKPLKGSVELGENLEIGYFEQEMSQNIETTCLQEIWNEFPGFTQYEVRSALAKCGLTTKHIESKCKVLSGGEQAKVRLCKLINRESNLLVLDEPTNHLDVDAKEELLRALKEYKGSILMVCHEPEFYERLTPVIWDCTKWTTKL